MHFVKGAFKSTVKEYLLLGNKLNEDCTTTCLGSVSLKREKKRNRYLWSSICALEKMMYTDEIEKFGLVQCIENSTKDENGRGYLLI